MTRNKAEKRAIRERMTKTGERYTTARHYLLQLHQSDPDPAPVESSAAPEPVAGTGAAPETVANDTGVPAEWIEQPGMSNEAIARNTGRDWHEWFAILDQWGGAERTHAEIARYLNDTYNPGGWFAQSITVGYERARGLRQKYQRPDGFNVNASKTLAAPVARLYAALVEDELRDQWLEPGTVQLRTSQPDKSARFDVVASGALLTVNLVAKGDAKASIQIQEQRLPAAAEVEPRRAYWKDRLDRLAALLTAAT